MRAFPLPGTPSRTGLPALLPPDARSPAPGPDDMPLPRTRPSRPQTRSSRNGIGNTEGERRCRKGSADLASGPSSSPDQQGFLGLAGKLGAEREDFGQVAFARDRSQIAPRLVDPSRRSVEEGRAMLVLGGRLRLLLEARRRCGIGRRLMETDGARRDGVQPFPHARLPATIPGLPPPCGRTAIMNAHE